MNCKPGDMAVVVRSAAGNEGRIVEVVSFLGPHPIVGGRQFFPFDAFPCWLCVSLGQPLKDSHGVLSNQVPIPDAWLKPLRDPGEDAQDESRAWLPPVPTQHKETAE